MLNKQVSLETDVSDTDRFGRLLRYVYIEGQMVNQVLVEQGYATAATFPLDLRYAVSFSQLEAEAREGGEG